MRDAFGQLNKIQNCVHSGGLFRSVQANGGVLWLTEEALAQIKEKGYHEKYLRNGKKVTLAGVAFDAEMRNLTDRKIEVVAE